MEYGSDRNDADRMEMHDGGNTWNMVRVRNAGFPIIDRNEYRGSWQCDQHRWQIRWQARVGQHEQPDDAREWVRGGRSVARH